MVLVSLQEASEVLPRVFQDDFARAKPKVPHEIVSKGVSVQKWTKCCQKGVRTHPNALGSMHEGFLRTNEVNHCDFREEHLKMASCVDECRFEPKRVLTVVEIINEMVEHLENGI